MNKSYEKKIFSRFRLSQKLVLCYTLPLLLIMTGYIIITASRQQHTQYQALAQHHESLNDEVLKAAEYKIDQMNNMFKVLYQNRDSLEAVLAGPSTLGYFSGRNELRQAITNSLYLTPQDENFVLYGLEDNELVLCAFSRDTAYNLKSDNVPWPATLFTGEYHIYCMKTGTLPILGEREVCVSLYRLVRRPSTGEICAVATVYEPLSVFVEDFQSTLLSDREIVQVKDSDGKLIYSDIGTILTANGFSTKNGLQLADISGKPYLHTEKQSSVLGWTIETFTPYSVSITPELLLSNSNLGVIGLLVLLSVLVSNLLSYTFTRPLVQLSHKFTDFGKGNFSTVRHTNAQDEIGIISRAYNGMVEQTKQLIHDKYELTTLKSQAELDALQNQINPHFLFNSLNSIKAMCILHNDEMTGQMVQVLADLLRTSLSSGANLIPLSEELEQLKRYIYLQSIRFQDKFSIEYRIAPDTENLYLPCLSLQPLVENIFQHAGLKRGLTCKITVTANRLADRLVVRICNNGARIAPEKAAELNELFDTGKKPGNEHIGMMNVYRRLYLFFGNESKLHIGNEDEQTVVTLNLPIREHAQEDTYENTIGG